MDRNVNIKLIFSSSFQFHLNNFTSHLLCRRKFYRIDLFTILHKCILNITLSIVQKKFEKDIIKFKLDVFVFHYKYSGTKAFTARIRFPYLDPVMLKNIWRNLNVLRIIVCYFFKRVKIPVTQLVNQPSGEALPQDEEKHFNSKTYIKYDKCRLFICLKD